MIGKTIGKFRIDRVLGRGAMGVVYRAVDTTIDRTVALKTVRDDLLDAENRTAWLDRFRREARAAARCNHPNIVTLFEFGDVEGTHFISMEFVDGILLSDYVLHRPRIDLTAVGLIIGQVLAALAYAHARGIVHRDIKPANIMLLDNGAVKVTDFGIARLDSTALTRNGEMIGTPNYMAPEQFTGATIDRRTDVFATGVVLYELVTGARPFEGQSLNALMKAVLSGPTPDPKKRKAGLSEALIAVLATALARDPDARFDTADAFATALVQALQRTAQSTEPSSWPSRIEQRDSGDGQRQGWPPDAATAVNPLPPPVIDQAIRDLTEFVGPLARVTVRRMARSSRSAADLYEALSAEIPDERQRASFLARKPLA